MGWPVKLAVFLQLFIKLCVVDGLWAGCMHAWLLVLGYLDYIHFTPVFCLSVVPLPSYLPFFYLYAMLQLAPQVQFENVTWYVGVWMAGERGGGVLDGVCTPVIIVMHYFISKLIV